MKSKLALCVTAIALAAVPAGAYALGKNEKGCLAGGAIGGLAGHFLGSGNHTAVGAVGGCAVGAVVANERKNKDARARAENDRRRAAQYTPREPRNTRPLIERSQG